MTRDRPFDTVSLQVFRNLFSSLADEMGIALQRASFSPNIKMRRDFSCAVFDDGGRLLAQAAHIPVHLGAMGLAMGAVMEAMDLQPGDVAILNDPFAGGTHLPDISLVSSAFSDGKRLGYVMSRAHHSDIGGITPASMPLATEIFSEGLIIPPVKLVEAGHLNEDLMRLIGSNVRTPDERRGDLLAQMAAQTSGERRFADIAQHYGLEEIGKQAGELMRYSELMTRLMISELAEGDFTAEDWMDDDGFVDEPVPIRVVVRKEPGNALRVDFSGTADQRLGPINAVRAVTHSALLYVIRTLISTDVPVNAGMLEPINLVTRPGSLVDALPPAAVSAGNVETSQRIVDVLFRALAPASGRVPAASQGTMNNLAFGGHDPLRGAPFAYYETLGGGMGARQGLDGMSGVHDHMSNTLNTPVEALEPQYPIRVRRYELRRRTGGKGRWRGGEGLRRDIEFLCPASVSIISERRRLSPYGLCGGSDGGRGENLLTRGKGTRRLPGKAVLSVETGDVLSIRTPGGGGYGSPDETGRETS